MGLKSLYDKISAFESSLPKKALSHSACQNGCFRCCLVDLSIFQVEADFIRSWFRSLSPSRQKELRVLWINEAQVAENFNGDKTQACHFLNEGSCTIYEVRPLICRTQGLALSFTLESKKYMDICPLNEKMLDHLSTEGFLNLDLLNLILSQVENLASRSSWRPRINLSELRNEFLV
jgi:uncharacterized protein